MAQDPVLQREMFNTRGRSAKGSGITSMVDDGSSGMTREERLQIAKAMLAEAQMKQSPEYYFNTLAASDRPAMTRPVASSAPPPAMQQMPAAQQMAQMQAAGVRPVGMADGGMVRHGYEDGSLVTPGGPMSYDELMALYAESGNVDRNFDRPYALGEGSPAEAPMMATGETQRVILGGPHGPSGTVDYPVMRRRTRRDMPGSLPSASQKTTDAQKGILSIKKPPEEKLPGDKPSSSDGMVTKLEQIKADREAEKKQNFNMALMQAGLAMMGGKSPNALQNIAEGGISGLAAYTGLEKSDRETALSERKLGAYEDSLLRKEQYDIARANALGKTSEARIAAMRKEAYKIALGQLNKESENNLALQSDASKRENRLRELLADAQNNIFGNQALNANPSEGLDMSGEVDPDYDSLF